MQRWTYFGRDVYAVGGNIDAARLSGINVARTLILVYAISGLLRRHRGRDPGRASGAASPLVGESTPLDAAAAVLLGGTSFSAASAASPARPWASSSSARSRTGSRSPAVSSFWQQVVTGAILIVAISIDRIQQQGGLRRRRSTGL